MHKKIFNYGMGLIDSGACGYNFKDCLGFPTKNITSQVIAADSRKPLFGAHVYFQNQPTRGAATAENGFFTLTDVPGGTPLVVSYTGYKPLIINTNEIPRTITLQLDELEGVTVIGKKKKKSTPVMFGGLLLGILLLASMARTKGDKPVKAKV